MNFLEKILWRLLAKRRLYDENVGLRYTAIYQLGEIANPSDFELLLPLLADNSQLVRNAASLAIKEIIGATSEPMLLEEMRDQIVLRIDQTQSLVEKLAVIEVMRVLSLDLREEILSGLITQSQSDLQYAVIQSLEDTKDLDILDSVLHASDTPDLLLRRTALQTWYTGISRQNIDEVKAYCTPRLHYLVRAAYELQTDGEFLREVLAYSDKGELPHPKAYPDFIIRYMTELLGRWEYDPEAYRSLHAIMVPSYFTFESNSDDERPFVML